jgi:phage tail sheath protein FI
MLLVEGPWADAPEAIASMSADPAATLGAAGADVAVYWPRLQRDRGDGVLTEISPLGAVAGVYARTDAERGVFIAPAGLSAVVRGARAPAARATPEEQDALNRLGVNLIRTLPQVGTVVWGARTQSPDDEWKYVPVRRLFLFIEESIDRGLTWVVFEPNGEALWQRVRVVVGDFLRTLWEQGALQGANARDSFFVKCDRTTMTQDDLDSGRLVCTVGIAPARPAEFVIFSIGAWTADADGPPDD